jgi:hypothetical protein
MLVSLRRVAFVVALLVVAACRQVTPLPAEALEDLHSLDALRVWFNGASDKPRLLVLLSPT